MPQPVQSTYKVLRDKVLNRDIDESWITWAQEMMEAGFESINLYTLAGITKPYNQFELIELTDMVFKDLDLDYANSFVVIRDYVYFLIKKAIDDTSSYLSVLKEISNLYLELDMDIEYGDFDLLYFAKDDLAYSENQWYWPEANRENIDRIIKDRFRSFISDWDLESEKLEHFPKQ